MIKYVKGDLIASDCTVIAHGCNCFHSFGAGIAKQVLRVHPEAFEADLRSTRGDPQKLGQFTTAVSNGRRIFNLYSQFRYGNKSIQLDYEALQVSLEAMSGYLEFDKEFSSAKIGLLKIGCGLAGGDWDRVSVIIEEVFGDTDVYVYLYDDKSAAESRAAGLRIQNFINENCSSAVQLK